MERNTIVPKVPFSHVGPWLIGVLIGLAVVTNAYELRISGTSLTSEQVLGWAIIGNCDFIHSTQKKLRAP